MISTVARLAMAGWRRRWLASLLTAVLVAVGSAALLLSMHLRSVADRPWHQTFEETHGGHLHSYGESQAVEWLATVDGVTETSGPTPLVMTSMQLGEVTYGLRAIGADDKPAIDRPVLIDGQWMKTSGEIVLERSFASTIGAKVGDAVNLRTVAGTLPVRVVGVAVFGRDASYPDHQPGEAFVTSTDLATMQPDEGRWFWFMAARVDDPARIEAIAQAVKAQLPTGLRLATFEDRFEDASSRTRTTTIVLRTFAIVLLGAVALVLVTLVNARVLDRAEEVATLRALGFTPGQVGMVAHGELFVLAALAAIAGGVVGSVLTPHLMRRSSELLGTVPTNVSPTRVLAAAAITLIVVLGATIVPTLRVARGGIVASLRSQPDAGVANRATRALTLRTPLAPVLAMKHLLSRPARSLATAAALTLTAGTFVAGLAFEATTRHEDARELEARTERAARPILGELAPGRPDPIAVQDATREQLRPIVRSFNGVLMAVAIVNLLATALLSLRRRRRDIAVTRAIGFTPEQVRRSLFCAEGVLGLVAAIAGIPFGIAVFFGVFEIVNGNTDLVVLPPAWQLVATVAATVAAVVAVIALPARSASSQTITEALHYE